MAPEEMKQIQDMITTTIQSMNQQQQQPAPTPTADPQAATTPAQQPAATAALPGVEALQAMMEKVLDNKMQRQESDVAQTIWNERLTSLKATNPSLGEYLDGNDEFGTPRMERINAAGDFAKRMESLNTLTQNFNAAQVASTGGQQQPVVPKKIKEQADKTNKQYSEMDKQLADGEMSPSDHTNQFFDSLEAEVLDQMSTH